MRARVPYLICWVIVLACDGQPAGPQSQVVEPAATTEEAVRTDSSRALQTRLESEGAVLQSSELLLWELRHLDGRLGQSDLVVVWSRFVRNGTEGWSLGQLFRHREGSDVSWQWYRVFDTPWLELRFYETPPSNGDVAAFLEFWDFESVGRNGVLIAATIYEDAWIRSIGEAPMVAYPDGTPSP